MPSATWKIWNNDTDYGQMLYRRATGELEEMESSKALCQVLADLYRPGMKVADVGCAAGHYLRSLRTRLDAQVDYTGFDATPQYIELAQKAFPTGATFQVGDIHELPAPDASFDLVMSNNVLLHLPPPPRQPLEELIRIARKHVVIRTVFGDRNYIVQEVRASDAEYAALRSAEATPPSFNYFNLYTEGYFRETVTAIDPSITVEVIKDDMWQRFDNVALTTNTGTRVLGDYQVSGNLLLDWRFLILTKP